MLGRSYADFRELRACELPRIPIPRTPVNKGSSAALDFAKWHHAYRWKGMALCPRRGKGGADGVSIGIAPPAAHRDADCSSLSHDRPSTHRPIRAAGYVSCPPSSPAATLRPYGGGHLGAPQGGGRWGGLGGARGGVLVLGRLRRP